MPNRILILEDEPEVQLALHVASRRIAPAHDVEFVSTVHDFTQALIHRGSEIELISLGNAGPHDAPRAATALAQIPPTAFVIVCASDPTARTLIHNALAPTNWPFIVITPRTPERWATTLWKLAERHWLTPPT